MTCTSGFIRWASDRLDDDGIVAFITNRAYIDGRQDDGFRKIAAEEFSDIYLMDLGSDVRRNPKISGTTHNVFGIQTGVAIGFFVREKAKLGKCGIHYTKREDDELAVDKLAYLGKTHLDDIGLEAIEPDIKHNWLNQSNSDFGRLLSLANKQTKFTNIPDEEQAIFKFFSNGVKTNRDEWVYDFNVHNLRNKALFFTDNFNALLDANDNSYPPIIKWSSTLRDIYRRGEYIVYDDASRIQELFRPFVIKYHFTEVRMNDRLTRNHYEMFGDDLSQSNKVIAFSGIASTKPFTVLATDKLFGFDTLEKTQCLPLYRYTEDGERVSNITAWGLRRINAYYRREFGEHFEEVVGGESITAADVFAYTYAVLHDPAYRHDYAVDLLREFPRLPLYHDWNAWVKMGRELLELHIGFEDAEPYPLEIHIDGQDGKDDGGRVILRADRERGIIRLDERATLQGVPPDAWRYMLGNRSALEWVLDQYKEKKPRDPTIAAKFNTYRFADYKEQVIDLLMRVCTVSVRTMDVVDGMAYWDGEYLVVSGDRDKREWSMMGLQSMFSRANDLEQDAEWSEV